MKVHWLICLTIATVLFVHASPAQMDNMPGMQHDHSQMPGMNHGTSALGNRPAAAAERSVQNSEAQQQKQAGGSASSAGDAQSEHRDAMHLQEPEGPSLRTGDSIPAPELLLDVDTRAPLTLQQFEDWAQSTNPTLKQAAALQQRSQQQARQAALPPNPTVGYSGEHIRGGSYGGGEQGAFVQQTVVLGGKLSLRRDVYRQQAAADTIGIEEQTYRVRADVQRAFYRALAAQAAVHVRQQLQQIADDGVETTHHLANLGQADAPDVLQAEVEAEQAKIDFVDIQREFLQRFRVLAVLCGQADLRIGKLNGDLEQVPDLNTDEAVAKVLAGSPEAHRAQQGVAIAEANRTSAKRDPVPDLKVQAGMWNSGDQIDGTNKRAGWMGFAQMGVELPLWNRNQGNTAAAEADISRARAEVTRTQLALKQQAEPLAQSYLTARFEAERYRTQLLPRAQRAYELYNMKYQQMAAAYPQVLTSQRTLFQLQMAYLHALENEWISAVGLQNYALQGGLNAPMNSRDAMIGLSTGGAQ